MGSRKRDVMADSKSLQDAHNAGEKDYSACGGQVNSNPITELFHPSYKAPSDTDLKEAYDDGWKNAKSQK
jgi:hypothetical protein